MVGTVALGCAAGGATGIGGRVGEAERTKRSLEGTAAQALAPQAFAVANQELALARDAEGRGDALGAELHAERAVAAYAHAVALARLARATQEEAAASQALASATELGLRYAAQRKGTDREADELDKQLRIAREVEAPRGSGAADPEREKARVVAAQALVTQARLLCSAARLVSPQAPGLSEAEAAVGALEKQVESGGKGAAPIDPAARTRAACLASLTKARRAAPAEGDPTDALLAELSQASAAGGKRLEASPARDERGVVVTLRGAFKEAGLTPEGEALLKDLGRVAAAHPTFAVQVVVHDAQAPSAAETATNTRRGEAIAKALTEGGAAAAKIKVEQAGARAPVVDPKDAKRRDRNARLEVVFITRARD